MNYAEWEREQAADARAQDRAEQKNEPLSDAELARLEKGPWWHYAPGSEPQKGW